MELELEKLAGTSSAGREMQQPKRQALPARLPRRKIRHEPESTTCACGCTLQRIGEDVAQKLDYRPGANHGGEQALKFFGDLPGDNNWVENKIKPIAIGRSNWLFAGSLRASQRSSRHELDPVSETQLVRPHAYLGDVLERLPTQPVSRVADLLQHRWAPSTA